MYQIRAAPLVCIAIAVLGLTCLAVATLTERSRARSAKGPGSGTAIDVPARDAEQACSMTPATPPSTSFAYIDCDVPGEQTLADWRRDRDAARRPQRRPRRALRLSRMLRLRWAT